MLALVIEAGGTSTRITSRDDEHDAPGAIVHLLTPNFLLQPDASAVSLISDLFERVRHAALDVLAGRNPDLVVLAYPGPMSESGVALRSPTILGAANTDRIDVKARVGKLWPHARVHVLNDLTAAGFFYVSQGHSDFCVTAVGSGIGNKVFIRGRPQIGSQGFGGEIGHLKTQPMPRTPIADVRADLGEIASGRGTAGLARQWLARSATDAIDSVLADLTTDDTDEVWSRAIASAFADEDPLAQRIVEATAYPLAHALGSLHMSLGLERFFIVGGFAHALGAGYGRLLARLAAEACWDLGQRWTDMIHVGARGEEEGLLGACHLAQRMMKRSRLNPAEAA